jgi:hypothetical protein
MRQLDSKGGPPELDQPATPNASAESFSPPEKSVAIFGK